MFKYIYFIAIPVLIITGCGSNTNTKAPQTHTKRSIDTKAKESFGYLANATVRIYKLGKAKELLFTEKTSNGKNLAEIGNFNAHTAEFHPNTYYQFEVSGGKNMDTDHNGIKDTAPSANTNSYVAIYKGHQLHISWWKRSSMSGTGSSE